MDQQDTQEEKKKKLFKRKGKKLFGFNQRLSRRIDEKKAEQFKEQDKNQGLAASKMRPNKISANMLKLQKKIRDVYDEEDDEDDDFTLVHRQINMLEDENDSSLFNALTEEEKLMVRQQETIENMKMQQTAGKMEAIQLADRLARDTTNAALKQKDINALMNDALYKPKEDYDRLVKKEVTNKLGLHGKFDEEKLVEAALGIKKVKEMGGDKATKNLDVKDVVRAGEGKMETRELAKLILEKSGQDVKNYKPKKSSKKKDKELKYLKPIPRKKQAEY